MFLFRKTERRYMEMRFILDDFQRMNLTMKDA